jgi:maltodextrin utilization protein YvdJ
VQTLSSDLKYIDFSGNYLAYTDKSKTVKDAVKEDIHTMILQQNNSYIMGMIALSAVLITTFLFLRK